MAVLRTILCALFMVTVALSKPMSVSEGEDSSEASESIESDSSEEAAAVVEPTEEPLQPALTGTDMPIATEATDPPGTQLPAAALPDPEDPQASTDTDALHLMPDDPSQTLGVDISQDMPSDVAHDSINAGTEHIPPDALEPGLKGTGLIIGIDGTNQPQVSTDTTTTTYQGFPEGATPPFPPHIIKSPSSTAPPVQIPIGATMTGVPVCFTFQFATSEPEPPRGDSM